MDYFPEQKSKLKSAAEALLITIILIAGWAGFVYFISC